MNESGEVGKGSTHLEVQGIAKIFRNNGADLSVLDEISFSVEAGQVIGIVGPSGCGKTTLLQIIGGLQSATHGEVLLQGNPIIGPNLSVSYVFQEDSLFPWKNVLGNVVFALEALGTPAHEAASEARRYLDLVGLSGFSDYYPAQLSGGMKQRTALARALATHPELILMDEPMASLDTELRENLQDEIAILQNRVKRTTVLVSHSLEEVVFLCDRVLILSARPARITEVLEIDLPLPRTPEIRASERFVHLKTHLWKVLHGFPDGSESTERETFP